MPTAPVTLTRNSGEPAAQRRFKALAVLWHLDFLLLAAIILMALLGIAILHGATASAPALVGTAKKQLLFFGLAVAALCVSCVVDYRWINRAGVAMYVFNLGALVFVLSTGRVINGARSWIDLGPINWQPSETMKLATVIVCAQWLGQHTDKLQGWGSIFIPGIICGVPAALVLVQPDLGTASLFLLLFLSMMLMAGVPRKKLTLIIGAAILGMCAMFPFLKEYQKARLTSFINPEADPLHTGYNLIQSKVAIGSGGLLGQGWGEGSQSIYRFLPEHHTDFIFASAVEQLGFIGGIAILAGYFFILLRMFRAMDVARDRFGGVMVAGLIAIFTGHIVLNIGMTMGLLPITGIPLPLLSYGGTFLVTMFLLFGLVLNVASRRYTFVGL